MKPEICPAVTRYGMSGAYRPTCICTKTSLHEIINAKQHNVQDLCFLSLCRFLASPPFFLKNGPEARCFRLLSTVGLQEKKKKKSASLHAGRKSPVFFLSRLTRTSVLVTNYERSIRKANSRD